MQRRVKMSNTNKSFIPEDNLPDCWKDEARINVLFAPFRNRSVNPKDWDTKLLFWKNLISLYCIHNKKYIFKLSELCKIFSRNGRSPVCLDVVIDDMLKAGEIISADTFLQKPSETWGAWITDVFIKKPVSWSFSKIKNTIISRDKDILYVHLHAVQTQADGLLNNFPEKLKNKVISLKELIDEINFGCNEENMQIILHYLLTKGEISIRSISMQDTNLANTTLIKICNKHKNTYITNLDIDKYTLEQSEKTLKESIEKLETEISLLTVDAKAYLIKGYKQSAKTCLRKKREVERCVEKRAGSLHNIQTLLSRIQDLDSDIQVLDSYKSALSRLRTTFSENGLTEEYVFKTMSELDEVLEMHDDIQSSLAHTIISNDEDVEQELADLIESNEKQTHTLNDTSQLTNTVNNNLSEELKMLHMKLPSPPTNKILDPKTKLSL